MCVGLHASVRDAFRNFFARDLGDRPSDEQMAEFFVKHKDLALEAQLQAERCKRYEAYLEENGLYASPIDRILAEIRALRPKLSDD